MARVALAAILSVSICSAGAIPATSRKRVAAPGPKVVGAAGLIAVAQHQFDLGNYAAASSYAASAAGKAPVLADYAEYIRAQASFKLNDYAEVAKAATRVFEQKPESPMVGAAAALAVEAELDCNSSKDALELVKKYFDQIPQPQADLLLARSFDATGDLAQSAAYYQRVYYEYPTSREATDAANALVDLKTRMAETYPLPTPPAMLDRAQKLFEAKQPAAARIELTAAIPQIAGVEKDLARVRLGEADYFAKNTNAAFEYLSALKVDDPEADAERLFYLVESARRLDRHADVKPFLDQLEKQHSGSPWRLQTLILVADEARVDNDLSSYLPLYRACAAGFQGDERAGWCHWRVTFESYRKDSADAYDLLREQIQRYPKTPDTNNALYFLGRLEEEKHDAASARACYEELNAHFPNTYYSVLARDRLKDPLLSAATADPKMLEFLHSISWPERERFPSFAPGELAQIRIERAHLLQLTGLNDFAEGELKFGARNDGEQENLYALELAKLAAARNAPNVALHYIKTYTPGYLYMPFDEAPVTFWQLAFPMPYRSSIQEYSHEQGLDPFLVAALIRQESEFNAGVISHANAYGLMQLLPSTGKQLARHFRIKRFSSGQLLTANRNIQLGTYYYRNLLNSFDGGTEVALASYNAGPGRAGNWRTWGPFREPAEFVESIPLHETRGYVQIVLRNADIYRRLYAGTVPDVPAYHPKPAPKTKLHRKPAHRSS